MRWLRTVALDDKFSNSVDQQRLFGPGAGAVTVRCLRSNQGHTLLSGLLHQRITRLGFHKKRHLITD